MQSIKRTITKKDTTEKAVDLSEILNRMREDQRQLDRKIAELRVKKHTGRGEEKVRDDEGLKGYGDD
jgi:hypothetical protein